MPIRLYYSSGGIPETLQSTLRENALYILKSVPEGYPHVCMYIAYTCIRGCVEISRQTVIFIEMGVWAKAVQYIVRWWWYYIKLYIIYIYILHASIGVAFLQFFRARLIFHPSELNQSHTKPDKGIYCMHIFLTT